MVIKNYIFFSVLLFSSITHADAPPGDFSIAQIPDTQGFMKTDQPCVSADQVTDMYRWIFNDHTTNHKNYQYIFHVGDIIGNPGYLSNPNDPYGQWALASKTFRQITAENPGIPFGFASGNHDYLWGSTEGYGDYSNLQALSVYYKFLKPLYETQNKNNDEFINGNQFISDPMHVGSPPKFPSDKYYPISYRAFNIKGHNFVALNLPYGLTNSAAGMANVNSFIDNTNALFILNIHTPAGTSFQPNGSFTPLINSKKKIFMVLYGHDLNTVSRGLDYETAPIYKYRDQTSSPAYVYRFDYQERSPYVCSPANKENGSNMPQHPLIRVYEFNVDWPSEGDLSWRAKDIQAWTDRPIYKTNYWNWGSGSAPTSATTKLYPNPNAETINTIRFTDYLSPDTACNAPVLNNSGGATCNQKVGSTVTICWKPNGSSPKNYQVKGYDGKLLTTTSNVSYDDHNVGKADNYQYYVYSICDGGATSPALSINIKNNDH